MSWKNIRRIAAEQLRGTGVSSDGTKPQKTYGEGRKCATDGCETVLSRYNKKERCYLHTERTPVDPDDREISRLQRERAKGKYRR